MDTQTLTLSANSPMLDLLDHLADTYSPTDLLDTLATYRAHVEDAIHLAVVQARAEGMTWEQVGDLLGVTRQAAQQRYGAER